MKSLKVAEIKDDDEGCGEGVDEGCDEGCDEGGEWLILSYLRGFEDKRTDRQTDKQTDICDCRVTFATEKFSICS